MAVGGGARDPDGAEFHEVADRVWVGRYAWWDVNVTLVVGAAGAVVVDTHSSCVAAEAVCRDLRRVPGLPDVLAVVNTHEHFDHTFGNATIRATFGEVAIHAHRIAAARTRSAGERIKAAYRDDLDDPRRDEVLATTILPADHLVDARSTLVLGDRVLTLAHLGRGHTAGDLVVTVPDADVLLAGDLVEESAPPAFGVDSFPLDWPGTLDAVGGMLGRDTVVVPGHGAVVDAAFVAGQQAGVAEVADRIRALAAADVPLVDALSSAEWPWPAEGLADAVARGYAHLAAAAPGDQDPDLA